MRSTIALAFLAGCAAPPLDRDLTPSTSDERAAGLSLAARMGFHETDDFRGYLAFITDLRNDRVELRRVVVRLETTGKIPDYARIRVGVVGPDGPRDSAFFGGWRHLEFTGVEKIVRPGGPDLLLITSETMLLPQPRAYYALAGERIELVRLEVDGKLYPNYYTSPNHTIGPVHPPSDEADALRALEGDSWTRRMSMLTWLAGSHYTGKNPELWHEDTKVAELARELKWSPRVKAAVEALAKNPDPWTRDVAALFLTR